MPPLGATQRMLVGFRDDDDRRYFLACLERGGLKGGKCADCRHDVYFDPGGIKCIKERDPVIVCAYCQDHYRYVERIAPSGMLEQV